MPVALNLLQVVKHQLNTFYLNIIPNATFTGMLRQSLATLEGEKEFIGFYRALLSQESLLSLFCRDFFSFCPFNAQFPYLLNML